MVDAVGFVEVLDEIHMNKSQRESERLRCQMTRQSFIKEKEKGASALKYP